MPIGNERLGMSVNVLIAGCGYVGCELARLLHANKVLSRQHLKERNVIGK